MKRRACILSGLAGLLLAGCGSLIDMGQNKKVDPRRVYLNDQAANDSLPPTLIREGLLLVLQPGDSYRLRLKTSAATDSLVFYQYDAVNGLYVPFRTVGSTADGGSFRYFPLTATKAAADYYLGFLRGPNGGLATLPDSVRLLPVDTAGATGVSVRLLMVRKLHGLATDSAKSAYAEAFHSELRSVFLAYGITLETSTVIVDSGGAPVTVAFGGDYFPLPGDRQAGAVNLYLVDSIRSTSTPGMVVGFAPRESFDLSASAESRVVLNVRGGSAAAMAVTAAHEIGHFIGLRHTTATTTDRGFDEDQSNRDDGFASTAYCSMLTKRSVQESAAREITVQTPGGRPYCLRVAGSATVCTECGDRFNLMFPYSCNPSGQKSLGADQRSFLRNNLKVLQ